MLFENIRMYLKSHEGHLFDQGFWAMIVYRFGRWQMEINPSLLRFPFTFFYKILFKLVQILTGIEIPCETKVGTGLHIHHHGGIIVSCHAVLGDNVTLRSGVVIGHNHPGETVGPRLGNGVDLGSGAKILGPVRIGDNVKIGANAVVITDLPSDCTAVGVPARVIPNS